MPCDLVICAWPYQCEAVALYYLDVAKGKKYTVNTGRNDSVIWWIAHFYIIN